MLARVLIAIFFGVGWSPTVWSGDGDLASDSTSAKRPNIVWIITEDNSKHYLKHFDPHGVATPSIEAMAEHGVTFDNAFSNAPVCSVARTTLITGCYAPRIGTQYHRRTRTVPLPKDVEMFPALLKQAGYHTSNNEKEDYNARPRLPPWDQSDKTASWKNRPKPEQRFFHVRTITLSHESSLHRSEDQLRDGLVTDPSTVYLPAYFPDTELFRITAAAYRDRMVANDREVKKVLDELDEAGELENTFVFYFSDHGGVLPRSKRYLYESGLSVPLVVRIPENFRDVVQRPLGSRSIGFVSFVDFAPTVLALAGVEGPEIDKYLDAIDGTAFLGRDVDPTDVDDQDTTWGYADRMDEKYDLCRSVRKKNWKYIRHFESFAPESMHDNYRMLMRAYQQWHEMHEAGTLNEIQDAYFQPRQPEALYDLENDPEEINNLATKLEYSNRLLEMRRELTQHLKATHDTGFVPEFLMLEDESPTPAAMGIVLSSEIDRYIDVAQLATASLEAALPQVVNALNSSDFIERYWAIVAATSLAAKSDFNRQTMASDQTLTNLVRRLTVDIEPVVAARASGLMAVLDSGDPWPTLIRSMNRAVTEPEALQIAGVATFVRDRPGATPPKNWSEMGFLFKVQPNGWLQSRVDYLKGEPATDKQKME